MSENQKTPQVRIRAATESDVNFIFNSWLKCYRHSINMRGCENPVYFAQQHKVLEGLCKKASVLIACNSLDISQIFGYSVAEKVDDCMVAHFVYVKDSFRRFGIATQLMEAQGWKKGEPMFYTHKTNVTDKLAEKHTMVYNPFLAYYAYGLA